MDETQQRNATGAELFSPTEKVINSPQPEKKKIKDNMALGTGSPISIPAHYVDVVSKRSGTRKS